MRKAVAARVVLALSGVMMIVPAAAVPVPWLYDVDVAVDGRTEAARLAVSAHALAEVLARVSGLAHVPRNAKVREALRGPEAYYNRFVFLGDGKLRIHFVPGAILGLADEARLPVWSANRPRVMAWLAVDSAGVRQIVDGNHVLAKTLKERARQRGVVLKLPLMDLEDRGRVQPPVIWGRLFSSLDDASKRYRAEVVLAGRVQERACAAGSGSPAGPDTLFRLDVAAEDTAAPARPAEMRSESDAASAIARSEMDPSSPGTNLPPAPDSSLPPDSSPGAASPGALESSPATDLARALESNPVREEPAAAAGGVCGTAGGLTYAGSLEAWMAGEMFATEFTVPDVQSAVRMAADFIADELAGRFAVLAREPERLALTIRRIETPIGYGRLLRYLDGLEFVTAVDVTAVDADRLKITLHTRAGLDQLVELFKADGLVRPDSTDAAVLAWQGP